jgi:hypothetical protein
VARRSYRERISQRWLLLGTKAHLPDWGLKNREDVMDQITRCPLCGKQMNPVITISGCTDLQCISCDDPAAKWAESPLTVPEMPIATEPEE